MFFFLKMEIYGDDSSLRPGGARGADAPPDDGDQSSLRAGGARGANAPPEDGDQP